MFRSAARRSLLGCLALAAGAAPLAAQKADARARTLAPGQAMDSVAVQLGRLQQAVDSLAHLYYDEDLSTNQRRQVGVELDRRRDQFEYAMRVAAMSGKLGALSAQLSRLPLEPLARGGATIARTLMQSRMAQDAAPRGWIGIVVTGAATEVKLERGELLFRYLSYPQVVSVDPSSPAERAGVRPNDTLVAYDGRDVRESNISLTRLLRPSAKVVIRVRRDGRMRELPVIVDTVPTRIMLRRDVRIQDVQVPWAIAGVPDAPSFTSAPHPPQGPQGLQGPRQVTTRIPRAPMAPPPPSAATTPFTFFSNGVAGAQMVSITEGLSRVLGVSSGVLVTTVPPGSQAHESGLRDGDVILRADGVAVRTVGQVREIVARAAGGGARSVTLDCVREKRAYGVRLQW